jgi:hypothetical protein
MANTTIVGSGSGATFRVGAVLSRTFEVFVKGFGQIFILALVPMSPALLIGLLMIVTPPTTPVAFDFVAGCGAILQAILGIVAQATILYGTFELMRGEPFTIGKSFEVGLRRALPVVGVSIVAGLAIGLASMALLIPGIIVMCLLYVAVPACVIERLGVFASLSRSADLTRGYRWQIFGLVLIVAIGSLLGVYVAGHVIGLFGSAILSTIVTFAWQVIGTAFGAVLAAVIYHDLRAAKEGVDVSKIVNIFD